jgi:hypothetical protein
MTNRHLSHLTLGCALAIGLAAIPLNATTEDATSSALRLVSSRVSLAGTSNVHAYTASTTAVRLVRLEVAQGVLGPNTWDAILEPGALQAFEIAISAAALTSPREGIDANMHKALKAAAYPEITFQLSRLEGAGSSGALRAVGVLTLAGVEREVTVPLKTSRADTNLVISGEVPLVMTDFGITPPKAMLGMLKTDPKVTVTFETVLAIPLT